MCVQSGSRLASEPQTIQVVGKEMTHENKKTTFMYLDPPTGVDNR